MSSWITGEGFGHNRLGTEERSCLPASSLVPGGDDAFTRRRPLGAVLVCLSVIFASGCTSGSSTAQTSVQPADHDGVPASDTTPPSTSTPFAWSPGTLTGVSGLVFDTKWSPNGLLLAAAGEDGSVYIWDASSQEPVSALVGHRDAVLSVAWSPDGERLATASRDRTVMLWDADGTQLGQLQGHRGGVSSVSWSPKRSELASSSEDGFIIVWGEDGQVLYEFRGSADAVFSVEWSPDGDSLAAASWDGTGSIWTSYGRLEASLTENFGWLFDAAWSPDGQRVALASDGGYSGDVRIYDVDGGLLRELPGSGETTSNLSWSPDGTQLVATSFSGLATVWDADSGTSTPIFEGAGLIFSTDWNPDGSLIAIGLEDGTVRVLSAP